MKKSMVFLLLLVVLTNSSFADIKDTVRYFIVYGGGIDTLIKKAGDQIGGKSLVFSETTDQFKRGESNDQGVIAFMSHGFSFWAKDVRMEEDTLKGEIKIVSATLVADPNSDLVATIISRTSGDANTVSDPPIDYKFIVWIACIVFACIYLIFATMKGWFPFKQRKST